ncbi:MAG: hypothetical protein M1816_005098 [Peltula sp. TS41687]|nr:MAG: hypothetical protein M1816_005098 [Peltula sp. TS41687]
MGEARLRQQYIQASIQRLILTDLSRMRMRLTQWEEGWGRPGRDEDGELVEVGRREWARAAVGSAPRRAARSVTGRVHEASWGPVSMETRMKLSQARVKEEQEAGGRAGRGSSGRLSTLAVEHPLGTVHWILSVWTTSMDVQAARGGWKIVSSSRSRGSRVLNDLASPSTPTINVDEQRERNGRRGLTDQDRDKRGARQLDQDSEDEETDEHVNERSDEDIEDTEKDTDEDSKD